MGYTVVFDVVQSGYRQWWFPARGLIFIAGTSWALFLHRKFPSKFHLYLARYRFGFSLVWTLLSFGGTFGEYERLSSALRDGRCQTTEGVVTDFHPMPYVGHQNEWFLVDRERFEYSDYIVTAGFNNTASHGGPIRQVCRSASTMSGIKSLVWNWLGSNGYAR